METSLIGKALDFGSNEYGFESHVSKLHKYSPTFLLNQINLHAARKSCKLTTNYSKKLLKYLIIFKQIGLITSFVLKQKNLIKKNVDIYLFYYNLLPLCKHYKLMTRPSRKFYISFKGLRLLNKRTHSSVFLISTHRGLITHQQALKFKIGGMLIGFFSI